MDEYNYCCDFMKWQVYMAGCKGFSVVMRKFSFVNSEKYGNAVVYSFMMQYRTHDLGKEEGKVSIGEVGLGFCPNCGANLETFINNNKEMIVKLAEEHKHLVLD